MAEPTEKIVSLLESIKDQLTQNPPILGKMKGPELCYDLGFSNGLLVGFGISAIMVFFGVVAIAISEEEKKKKEEVQNSQKISRNNE